MPSSLPPFQKLCIWIHFLWCSKLTGCVASEQCEESGIIWITCVIMTFGFLSCILVLIKILYLLSDSVSPSVSVSVCLSVCLSLSLSLCLCLSVCMVACLSVSLGPGVKKYCTWTYSITLLNKTNWFFHSFDVSICISTYLCLSVCLSVCLSLVSRSFCVSFYPPNDDLSWRVAVNSMPGGIALI